jgi:hypothetical protein
MIGFGATMISAPTFHATGEPTFDLRSPKFIDKRRIIRRFSQEHSRRSVVRDIADAEVLRMVKEFGGFSSLFPWVLASRLGRANNTRTCLKRLRLLNGLDAPELNGLTGPGLKFLVFDRETIAATLGKAGRWTVRYSVLAREAAIGTCVSQARDVVNREAVKQTFNPLISPVKALSRTPPSMELQLGTGRPSSRSLASSR